MFWSLVVQLVLPTEGLPRTLWAGVHVLVAAPLTHRLVLLPLADGVSVLHDDLVHPGERLRKQHRSLEEAQVTSMLGEGKHNIGHLFWRGETSY